MLQDVSSAAVVIGALRVKLDTSLLKASYIFRVKQTTSTSNDLQWPPE